MSANHTITDVDPRTNEWTAPDGGKVIYYRVNLDTQGSNEVSIGRKEGKPAPKVGETVFGVVEETARGLKFKAQTQGGGNYKPRDPAEIKAIQRQHSQEMAILALDLAHRLGVPIPYADSADFFKKITGTADWFDKDIANGKAGE